MPGEIIPECRATSLGISIFERNDHGIQRQGARVAAWLGVWSVALGGISVGLGVWAVWLTWPH
jgi:hypothetical protein